MAKKTSKGAADDIALINTTGVGADLDAWLNQQGIGGVETASAGTQPKVSTEPEPISKSTAVEGQSESATPKQKAEPVPHLRTSQWSGIVSDGPEEPTKVATQQVESVNSAQATGKTGKQRERYEGQFFRRIEGFKKPTNMMYMSEKTYRLLTFLLRCSKESNAKITMPEVLENILSQHIKDNESVIAHMQQEHLERQSKGF